MVGIPYAIAAQSRYSGDDNTGFSFVNCTVVGDGPVLLGRAYGDYSRVIYSYTDFDLDVRADGWEDWGAPSRQKYGYLLLFYTFSIIWFSNVFAYGCVGAVRWCSENTSAEGGEQIEVEE